MMTCKLLKEDKILLITMIMMILVLLDALVDMFPYRIEIQYHHLKIPFSYHLNNVDGPMWIQILEFQGQNQ